MIYLNLLDLIVKKVIKINNKYINKRINLRKEKSFLIKLFIAINAPIINRTIQIVEEKIFNFIITHILKYK